jgi:uncharacterized protein
MATQQQTVRGTTQVRLPITGMTCASCERRVAHALMKVPGVRHAEVSARSARAVLTVEGEVPWDGIAEALEGSGYAVGRTPWLTRDRSAWDAFTIAVVVVGTAAVLLSVLGVGDITGRVGDPGTGGLLAVLLIGLTAGVSTCMALVGGLVLAVSAARVRADSTAGRWRPHLAFHAGRIVGFFVLGAALGAIGARLSLPSSVQALLLIVVAVFMVLLGLRLTGISPRLSGVSLALPASVSKVLGLDQRAGSAVYSDTRAAALGAATFFLPCGFTQVVQLYAMTTASPLQSGLVMAVFAVGTAPGLLALGGLPSLATGSRRAKVLAVVGVALMLFALVNITSAAGLLGWRTPSAPAAMADGVTSNVTVGYGSQTVTMRQDVRGYAPDATVVVAGLPIHWVIDSVSEYTCAAYLREVGGPWSLNLRTGVNTVELPAMTVGQTFSFTCVMGMYSGSITAVAAPAPAPVPSPSGA